MADQQDPHSLASTFPNPPSFWRDFTAEKIARIETLRQAYATEKQLDKANAVGATTTEGDGAAAATPALLLPARIPGVPDDLALLQPPPEPADGRWRVFGDQYMLDDKLPTLEEQGILNLPPTHPSRRAATTSLTTATNTAASLDARDGTHYDHALELKRLVKSLLVNFLELTGTLARNPAHAAAKVDDLRTLLINIHHALNEYRPHQARESAAEMMQEHLDRTRRETVAVRSQVDRARRVLEGLGSLTIAQEALLGDDAKGGGRVAAAAAVDQALERDKARETEVWAEVDALFA